MSKEKYLEDAVAKTAATAAGWVAKVKALEIQIAETGHAVTAATRDREQHALASTHGDPSALAAIKAARSRQHDAEQSLVDLQFALPAAILERDNAEKAAKAARRELALLHAGKLKRQRVAAAARMDDGLAAVAKAYVEFERLGRELQNFPDLDIAQGGSLSHYENVTGFRRIAASLPAFFVKMFPTTWSNTDARRSLAESEAAFWQIDEQPEAKAA